MRLTWILASTYGLLTGCTTEIAEPEGPGIDAYIQSLPYLPVADTQVQEGARSADKREGDYSCSTQNLQETRQFDKIVAYAANSDSMYPGALVSADSVLTGLFTQQVLDRAPATISVSLENLGGKKSALIESPSLSTYREALTGVLQQEITGSTPANQSSEIEEVHSKEQLDMALGVQASWGLGVASLKTSFDWSQQETRSRYVVKFTQAYYTVDLDAPASPSALLAPTVQLADVQAKMNEQHPPVYVSSVTYGRMVLFTFESEYSSQEMGAALEFAYRGGVDVKGDVSINYKEMLSKSKITAFILGGDAGTAVTTIDSYDKLIAFIKSGGNYTRESPGAPIAYKLNYLKDNSPARMSYTTDYTVKDCVRVSQKVRVTLNAIAVDDAGGDAGDDLEIYGNVWIESSAGGSATMFSKNDGNYVRVREGQQFGQGSPLAEAVLDVSPKSGQQIRLRANLRDVDDFLNPDDALGNETTINLFETGWRKESTVTLTGDSARIRVVFSLTPI